MQPLTAWPREQALFLRFFQGSKGKRKARVERRTRVTRERRALLTISQGWLLDTSFTVLTCWKPIFPLILLCFCLASHHIPWCLQLRQHKSTLIHDNQNSGPWIISGRKNKINSLFRLFSYHHLGNVFGFELPNPPPRLEQHHQALSRLETNQAIFWSLPGEKALKLPKSENFTSFWFWC